MGNVIKGSELNELFFQEIIVPILKLHLPNLRYSAALIGWGSEVLGFDDVQSADHNWGLRFQLFLSERDFSEAYKTVSIVFDKHLPSEFRRYPVVFSIFVNEDQRDIYGSKKHNINISTVRDFFNRYLDCDPFDEIEAADWLTFAEHKLLGVTNGRVFHDGLGELEFVRQKFSYYPKEIWLYMIAAQWIKIFEEQAFVGRCGYVGDEFGSMLIASRQVKNLMQLSFLMERKYAPYSKWFGTAFSRLDCARKLTPIFQGVLNAKDWNERQIFLAKGYEIMLQMQDDLKITTPLEKPFTKYDLRKYLVIRDESFVKELLDNLKNCSIENFQHTLGSINQFVDSCDQINNLNLTRKLKKLYE